ncbi:aminoacyl-tRNA hydrolase [Desulfolutivibrio sulfoxidireducens]|uniref:aminoacyl-tRNA hydrolase n=1 Tax=Desulfolutivibrio sulfoxidireducens TaxID=2773299 RepID=UPI00159E3CD9|nr:aminoacyl-tRNA hydrolase [Desulfolutivibrio sulfoxidireducens]QLA15961.1 aminoacyl-tRNA hydrolase [Desulfolutivibrio sulfoxidireducens]
MAFDALIMGLGNPGPQYAATRHNLGFWAADALARLAAARGGGASRLSSRKDVELFHLTLAGPARGSYLLAKPLTFMNLSGLAAAHLCGYYKIAPENLVVLHDELDLPLGRVRVKRGGGNAGHQGLNSIARELGLPDFVRIRLGIGRPAPGRDVKGYVLERFPEAERAVAEGVAADAAGLVETFLAQGLDAARREAGQINRCPAGESA